MNTMVMSAKTWAAQPWAASMYFIIYHYLSHQLAYRAAMKLFHPCLSFASLWMVPQVWFIFFISASTILQLFLWGPVDCNFGDGVGIPTQHVPNPAPLLPVLSLAPS